MKTHCALFGALCLLASSVHTFSISNADVQGDGKDETKPAKEDSVINLRCTLSLSNNEEWEVCQWEHVLKGQYDSNNKEKNIKCTGTPDAGGRACSNSGGSHETDELAKRIKFELSTNICGISISKAHYDDNGKWECRVLAAGTTQYSSLDLYVSNHSIVNVSDPTAGNKIDYNFASNRPEIRSSCRGYGGRPQPTFAWYVNEDRYQIRNDLVANPPRAGVDPILGAYVEESITFTPSRDRLCNDYGLSNVCQQDLYTFKLICKTDQGTYYQRENTEARSEAIVEVRNGSGTLVSSIVMILVGLLVSKL